MSFGDIPMMPAMLQWAHRRILFRCCGSPKAAARLFILSDSVIVFTLILSSLGEWYQSVYIYIQLCKYWCLLLGGMGSEFNLVHHYAYSNFFSLFLQLNGSGNAFKLRIYFNSIQCFSTIFHHLFVLFRPHFLLIRTLQSSSKDTPDFVSSKEAQNVSYTLFFNFKQNPIFGDLPGLFLTLENLNLQICSFNRP